MERLERFQAQLKDPNLTAELKHALIHIKPLCDALMVQPSAELCQSVLNQLSRLRPSSIQELQLYVLFPFTIHLKSESLQDEYGLQQQMLKVVKYVFEQVQITNYDLFMKYHACLITLIFDKERPGMVANVPEELKLEVTECLLTLMLKTDKDVRVRILKNNVPTLAGTIFVTVHMAKQERLRPLRITSIHCMAAYLNVHSSQTDGYTISHGRLALAAADAGASMLPGVMSALSDVAVCANRPGHALRVAALNTMHRVVCLVMSDAFLSRRDNATIEDISRALCERDRAVDKIDAGKQKMPPRMSPAWYVMSGQRLKVVIENILPLQLDEHPKVRMELAVLCSRVLFECSRTMQPCLPDIIDILITLSKDEFEEISKHCKEKLDAYFNSMTESVRSRTLDMLADQFVANLISLPRVMNGVESSEKLAALSLLHGYISVMTAGPRPQRLTSVLSLHKNMMHMCEALIEATRLNGAVSLLTQVTVRDVTAPPTSSHWLALTHIDNAQTQERIHDACRLIGEAECADLVVDQLLDLFDDSPSDRKEIVLLLNWIGSAPNCSRSLPARILDKYTERAVWSLPLEVAGEAAPSDSETCDVTVYNPRSWEKISTPGLYEGAVETRYTHISYQHPRVSRPRDPSLCLTLAEAHSNMLLSCLLVEGVGGMALRLREDFQPYLLKTLCLVLERVGSSYEQQHLSGLKAIHDITRACGLRTVAELLQQNADYFTHQITTRLKKSWNSKSALQMLTVVLEHSDVTIMDYLYGIVTDVLVQSCDKYSSNDLTSYLHVFLTCLGSMQKWFPNKPADSEREKDNFDVLEETFEYMKTEETERRSMEKEDMNCDAEEMFSEDAKKTDDVMDYDDTVTAEKPPLPQHVTLTVTILKRCLNFIPSRRRDERILALQVTQRGLVILQDYEDELLPMVHLTWSPLVARFEESSDAVVVRSALEVLVSMALVSRDFIRHRTVKEVLPSLFKFLLASSADSHLKDVGSAYRHSARYRLQCAVLEALPALAVSLQLDGEPLTDAMAAVDVYLSAKQPKPLQAYAVSFYRRMLSYSHGAAWHHLRVLCNNNTPLSPPAPGDTLLMASPDDTQPHASPGDTLHMASPGDTQPMTSPGETQSQASPGDTQPMTSRGDTHLKASPGDTLPMASPGDTHTKASPGDTLPTKSPYNNILPMETLVGTPYQPVDKLLEKNIQAIFNIAR